MRFVVAQSGARHGYAVPIILEKAGMLERFYTDMCGSIGFGKTLATAARLPFVGSAFQRLRGRVLPRELIPKTITFEWESMAHLLRSQLAASEPGNQFAISCHGQQRI